MNASKKVDLDLWSGPFYGTKRNKRKITFRRIVGVLKKNSEGVHIVFGASENNSMSEVWFLVTNLIASDLEWGTNGASVPF
jgi:hypothetical protein